MTCELEFAETERVLATCPPEIQPNIGDYVIFEMDSGEEIGKVVKCDDGASQMESAPTSQMESAPTPQIKRLATQEDMETFSKNKAEAEEAFKLCKEKVKELGMPIKVASVHIQFDNSLLHIDFLAEKRIGLKRLTRELAKIYKTRIEFRQIGVRTYARQFNAFGVCGRPLCCATFLKEFEPITMETVKMQNLSCGAGKLTGVCGRLMCCLAYEKELYEKEPRITRKKTEQT